MGITMEKKYTQKAIEIMQAWLDGKEIEYRPEGMVIWKTFPFYEHKAFNFQTCEYRIKPTQEGKPKYRPFESVKEIADAMAEHGSWVKRCYNHDWLLLITGYSHKCIDFGNKYLTLEEACNEYVFADGTPFGKLVEE